MATKIKKILITGARGFIGRHLSSRLSKIGYRVISYDIQDGYNINDYYMVSNVIKRTKPDLIIHLAAISNGADAAKYPQSAIETNITGSFNILRAASESNIHTIIASSAAVEEANLSLYGTTKLCMENIAETFTDVTIARFYNVYGPRSKSVINKFVKLIKQDKPIHLNGNTTRDYIHVDDLVNVLISNLENKGVHHIKVGTGKETSLRELVSLIEQILNKKAIIISNDPIKEIQNSKASFGVPSMSLKEGISKLI
jgi:nucleoside-diphosphate-sugar epimerase